MKNLEQKVVDVKEDVTTLSEKSIAVADNYKPAVDTKFVEKKEPEKKEVKSLQSIIIAARSKHVGKVVIEKPYTEEKTSNLTKDQRDAVKSCINSLQAKALELQSNLLDSFISGDAELIEAAKIEYAAVKVEVEAANIEAAKLSDVDAKFKIPLKDMNGLELWIEELKLYQSLSIDAILELYRKSFKEGSEEYRKIALYQSSNLLVASNPIVK